MSNILQTLMDFVMIYSCATESVSIAIRTEPFSAMCASFVFNTREGQYIYTCKMDSFDTFIDIKLFWNKQISDNTGYVHCQHI